ncbi:hypothetical protein, partial [Cesiribacter andamanensis]|uniref:hypothetical protein n=1 Tax=Cesiribacter andamanensis TaxID=649507 RepID=UPI001377B52E
IQAEQAVFKLNEEQLGEGISHLTLFNQNRQPVAERLWFTHPQELKLVAATDKPVYASREKVRLALSVDTPDPCVP